MPRKKKTIEEMQALAASRDGRCLSASYTNCDTPLEWECALGHRWMATPRHIEHHRSWCPECARHRRAQALRQHTIEEMQELARTRGGQCLSQEFVNSNLPLQWRCAMGHTWNASASDVLRGSWCRKCSFANRRHTLEEMQALAASRGGHCLSECYIDSQTKLLWQCVRGHIWRATPGTVIQGSWCRRCYEEDCRHQAFKDMQALAASHGGRCLSERYLGAHTKLLWQCARGHTWWAAPTSMVSHDAWCRECRNEDRGRSLKDMQALAASRGGRCLSARFINMHAKLLWQCAQGHTWQATSTAVLHKGTWCRQCSDERKAYTIGEMQELAASRGGHCLSGSYTDAHTKLLWECARGHTWPAIPDSVVRGTWCPQCAILDRTYNPDKRRKYLAGKE
jgi:hypothetical protein